MGDQGIREGIKGQKWAIGFVFELSHDATHISARLNEPVGSFCIFDLIAGHFGASWGIPGHRIATCRDVLRQQLLLISHHIALGMPGAKLGGRGGFVLPKRILIVTDRDIS
jgi:hypothetical protein